MITEQFSALCRYECTRVELEVWSVDVRDDGWMTEIRWRFDTAWRFVPQVSSTCVRESSLRDTGRWWLLHVNSRNNFIRSHQDDGKHGQSSQWSIYGRGSFDGRDKLYKTYTVLCARGINCFLMNYKFRDTRSIVQIVFYCSNCIADCESTGGFVVISYNKIICDNEKTMYRKYLNLMLNMNGLSL